MSIFDDGQDILESLSDEAIFGEEGRQEEGKSPEADTDKEVATEEEGAVEETATEEEPKVEEKKQEEPPLSAEEIAKLKREMQNLRAWATKVSMENGDLRRQANLAPTPPPEKIDSKAFVKDLLAKGQDALTPLVNARVEEVLKPYREQEEHNRAVAEFGRVMQEATMFHKELETPEGKEKAIKKMVDLAAESGDNMAWKKDPEKYFFRACRQLFGVQKVVDQDAINAAVEAARESFMKEMAEQKNKEGLSIAPHANKPAAEAKKTPEEQIKEDIFAVSHGGLFS